MQAASGIFFNGIFGVFMGLAVLYAAIKVIRFTAGREPDKKKEE